MTKKTFVNEEDDESLSLWHDSKGQVTIEIRNEEEGNNAFQCAAITIATEDIPELITELKRLQDIVLAKTPAKQS